MAAEFRPYEPRAERAIRNLHQQIANLEAELEDAEARVATLEGGIREHRAEWEAAESQAEFPGDTEGAYRTSSLRLWSLLDGSHPSVAEMAGSFEGGPDSVQWLREQRGDDTEAR